MHSVGTGRECSRCDLRRGKEGAGPEGSGGLDWTSRAKGLTAQVPVGPTEGFAMDFHQRVTLSSTFSAVLIRVRQEAGETKGMREPQNEALATQSRGVESTQSRDSGSGLFGFSYAQHPPSRPVKSPHLSAAPLDPLTALLESSLIA